MQVQRILGGKASADVATIRPDASIADAASALASKGIGALVVTNDGEHPDGILSERDIVREMHRSGTACLDGTVGDLMTANPQCCALDETADAVLVRMTEGRFRHMPVVDGGKMVGLISIGDVVKARLSELSMEKDALTEMIMGH